MFNNIEQLLRKLAKRIQNVNLFHASKEINGIYLFKNKSDLSKIQHLYLNLLYFYYNLNTDVITGEVSERVYDDIIYEDAYALWKQHKHKQPKEKQTKDKKSKDLQLVFTR
jgi:hypothetical protein